MHRLITDSAVLKQLCERLAEQRYVTVDTEFIREKTYYAQLCLIQVADADGTEAAIDPLASGIDLQPFYDLMQNEKVLKVFHAAKQDLEIFYHATGQVPHPIYDSQVAAMVCGYGEQVGYEALVNKLLNEKLDKGSRYTDWSQRPLSQRQIDYAISDVTHLCKIYEKLDAQVREAGRERWIVEEMAILENPNTYNVDPQAVWRRLKCKQRNPMQLHLLREMAAWRENFAQRIDKPRGRILKDEVIVQIAEVNPKSLDEMLQTRGVQNRLSNSHAEELFGVIEAAREHDPETFPPMAKRPKILSARQEVLLDALKLLLKWQCAHNDVASKLVARKEDVVGMLLGDDEAEISCLHGWRYEVFGRHAKMLLDGKLSFSIENNKLVMKEL